MPCVYLLILSDVMFWCFVFPTSVCVSTIILRLRKAEFIKWVDPINILLIGFVKFEIKQWFSANQDQVSAWLSLARVPTARVFFSEPFSRKETALSFFSLLSYASLKANSEHKHIMCHIWNIRYRQKKSCKHCIASLRPTCVDSLEVTQLLFLL